MGVVAFDTSRVVMAGDDSGSHGVSLLDRNANPVITIPNNTGGTWPNSAIQFLGVIAGNNGRGKDLVIRNNTPLSRVRFLNSGNTTQLLTMDDAGVANFFGPDVYVHGTLHVASLKTDASKSFGGEAQEMSVQSPEMMTVLSGNATMDESGGAQVTVPDAFEKLNQDFRYQLTTIGSFAPVYVAQEIRNDTFRIAGGKAGMRVSWQVTGVRKNEGWVGPLQLEQFSQPLGLGAAYRNLGLLLVVHAKHVGALEPRYNFAYPIDVHEVRTVRAPE